MSGFWEMVNLKGLNKNILTFIPIKEYSLIALLMPSIALFQ